MNELKYQTYENYQISNYQWFDTIPMNNKIYKFKQLGDIFNGLTYDPKNLTNKEDEKGCLVLRSSNIQNGKIDFNDNKYINMYIPIKKILKEGDLLICGTNGSKHLVGKSALITKNEVGMSFGGFMLILRQNKIFTKYLYYLMNSDFIKKQIEVSANTSTIYQLTKKSFDEIIGIEFSKKEQLAIVKFLDEKTTIIDKKIEILKKQNKLEKELEKVLINQCVTKGVDSFTKLDKDGNLIDFDNKFNRNKEEFDLYMNENGYIDSKVEWLGYININCKLSKMKFEVKNANNGKNNSNDTPVLSLTKTGVKIKTDITFGKCATSYIGHQIVNIGNFVFSPRDYDQTPIVSGVCYDYGCTSNLYMVFNVNCDNISEYINIWFWNLKYLVNYFENFSQGMRYSFNGKTFGEIPFIKYNKKEQFKIIKFLNNKTNILEQKRIKREIEITLLEEYKKTLINDVVTGKIKVIKY